MNVGTRIWQVYYFEEGERWSFGYSHSFIMSVKRNRSRNSQITTSSFIF
jgi:hypothetical protein